MGEVLSVLAHLNTVQRKQIIAQIAASVDSGNPKRSWMDQDDFDKVIDPLKAYPWAKPLVTSLKSKAASLPTEEADE